MYNRNLFIITEVKKIEILQSIYIDYRNIYFEIYITKIEKAIFLQKKLTYAYLFWHTSIGALFSCGSFNPRNATAVFLV